MILAYLISLMLGAAVFFMTAKLSMPTRLGLSVGVFLVLAIAITVVLTRVSDHPPVESHIVDHKQPPVDKQNER